MFLFPRFSSLVKYIFILILIISWIKYFDQLFSLSEYGNVRISHSPDCMSPPANFQETSVPFQGPLVSEQGPSGPEGPLAAPQSPSAPSQGPMAPAESQDPLATLGMVSNE